MTRRSATVDAQAGAERIRAAAIALFRERGYHGTSVRDLAQAVQMEPASLYYHYPSKQDILIDLFDRIMDEMIAGVEQAIGAETGADRRLRAAVRFHVIYHIARQDEAFISHSELRALTGAHRRRIVAKRDHYEKLMRAVLADGVAEGCFAIDDVPLAATAILMMCSGVSDWFERRGRLSAADVAEGYAAMVLRMVEARGGAAGAGLRAARKAPVARAAGGH